MTVRDTLERISKAAIRKPYKVARIAALGIRILPPPPAWRRRHRFTMWGRQLRLPINCFAYALDLHQSKLYRQTLAKELQQLQNERYASSVFMQWFLAAYGRVKSPHSGDLVVYFDADLTPKHAGIFLGGRVVCSKWGEFEPIFIHPLWHVPSSYGITVKFYQRVSRDRTEAAFISCL